MIQIFYAKTTFCINKLYDSSCIGVIKIELKKKLMINVISNKIFIKFLITKNGGEKKESEKDEEEDKKVDVKNAE